MHREKTGELEEKMDQYWAERSKSYSEQNLAQLKEPQSKIWKKLILDHAPKKKCLNILDIGTGPGFFAILLAMAGHKVTAVDRNTNMLKEARKNAKAYGVTVDFIQVGDELPFADETFDLIVSRDVTWTLTDPEKTMLHWMSKVKEGGYLQYFDANWNSHLLTEESKKEYEAYQKYVKEQNGFYYSKAKQLDAIAERLPMTYLDRPIWDVTFWLRHHYAYVCTICNLNSQIYTEIEQMQYKQKPEFLIIVEKRIRGEE